MDSAESVGHPRRYFLSAAAAGFAALSLPSESARLPNPDKQFIVMPGIAHTSSRSENWALVYRVLDGYFSQPAPVYVG